MLTPLQVDALAELARVLHHEAYRFVAVTPETHRRVLARRGNDSASSLRDVFGWNLPFDLSSLDPRCLRLLVEADAVEPQEASGRCRSRVRFSTLDGLPYLHSAYPTREADAVFFGPDTYRFVQSIEREVARSNRPLRRVLDVGCGSGAGGLMAARWIERREGRRPECEMIDVNARALCFAEVNARTFDVEATMRQADLYAGAAPGIDLIVANPPYLLDDGERLYRHGGGPWGSGLSERIVVEGLPLLSDGGSLVIYTGAPQIEGRDPFYEAVLPRIDPARFEHEYRELDPDVFGEELEQPAYERVERIAAVTLVVRKKAGA